ncbi:MAG TPA: DNA mismatch repair protein MutS [Bacillota bacterium]|nr:DNA mismatch repair protein MutS [Bacillota bacterium]
MTKTTPMMQQYTDIKSKHEDAFLFFRLGDFYELFNEDAIRAAKELEITLTQRDPGRKDPIPMCGVPHHSAEGYIKTLVDRGYKVAICEQVEDPKEAVGVVKREVVQIVTPGTVMESTMLDESESNYIVSLSYFSDESFVLAYSDLSTGENKLTLVTEGWDAVVHELYHQSAKEIVVGNDLPKEYEKEIQEKLQMTLSYQSEVSFNGEYRHLYDHLNDERLIEALCRLLNYIERTQKRSMDHLQRAEMIDLQHYLSLDMFSKRNLELTQTILKKGKHGSLLWVLDDTKTAMGARQLKKWIERPLLHQQEIEKRHNIVEHMHEQFMLREEMREALQSVYDVERLAGRVSYGNMNARDFIQLKKSLQQIPAIKDVLHQFQEKDMDQLNKQLTYPNKLVELLEKSIVEDPPMAITEGNIIKDGYNEKLDTYRSASRDGKKWIATLEKEEKERTNIRSLKIGYNRVFGYYIEVTRANLHLIDEERYERKQTLTNAERFIIPELKEKERLILEAEENSISLEHELFLDIREHVSEFIPTLQAIARMISSIDVLQSFATISEKYHYRRPTFHRHTLHIKQGRHPVIERVMQERTFVPNDILLHEDQQMLLITGPNMSGKSTYMRQLALISIMAQIGCFVPCEEAQLVLFDRIFTRIGAADDLVSGQSTFMVEMLEANHALQHATEKSLILLDEIGRGTSTYDGMALAQAIIEYIHDHIHAKTLFSTHYHELTQLEESLNHLKNVHVRAEEDDGKVIFLHQVQDGAADESYGIQVAELAELPADLIQRATTILKQLEGEKDQQVEEAQEVQEVQKGQLSLFGEPLQEVVKEKPYTSEEKKVLKKLSKINTLELTPLEAMNKLYELQKSLSK